MEWLFFFPIATLSVAVVVLAVGLGQARRKTNKLDERVRELEKFEVQRYASGQHDSYGELLPQTPWNMEKPHGKN